MKRGCMSARHDLGPLNFVGFRGALGDQADITTGTPEPVRLRPNQLLPFPTPLPLQCSRPRMPGEEEACSEKESHKKESFCS